ncbi:hypothetical protein MIND_01079000 [Mycena indigotica]|uniref:DUF3835 domain-containing protein n=1 Tax=Mycena indigotica TaxID=2126181 RepID=A0A8H6VVE8_9AGAR|nr:uncharacterized protein MIND_01079000 [Mycena indigotica]KAF7295394.1 hypothetical protein MIND_01079000 [Mycena indigotica]
MTSKAQNLNDGGAEALQALLRSLDPTTAGESLENVAKLSKRLAELIGDDGGQRNEDGQLLNDEGLPIIEITEQVDSVGLTTALPEPAPLSLQPWEAERRRRERDRILDLLEEEERAELAREEQLELDQEREEREQRRKKHEAELAGFKAMKEMHKRMGKALVGKAKEDKPAPSTSKPQVETKPTSQKSVKWANAEVAPPVQKNGGVVLGRSRPNTQDSTLPMQVNVVERFPSQPSQQPPDSDEASDPPDSDDESNEEGSLASDDELADEVDLEFANHQREVALEYHAKRAKMTEAAAQAMKKTSAETMDPYITAEDSSTQPARKSALSHFQANRLATAYHAATPATADVLPEVKARTLQHAIRLGKLDDNDRLVGGEAGESGSEDDEAVAQEIIELLQKGEVFNAGPDGIHAPIAQSASGPPAGPPPSARKPPASKFKLSRGGHAPSPAPTPTPPSEMTRSSPKLANTPPPIPSSSGVMSSVIERPTTGFSSMIVESPSFPSGPQQQSGPTPVMSSTVPEKTPVQSRRPQQPPAIVRASDKPAKVSRFLAGRNNSEST